MRMHAAVYLMLMSAAMVGTCSIANDTIVAAEPQPPTRQNLVPMPTDAPTQRDDKFARALYAQLASASDDDNVVVSPASVASCMLMALGGARGGTADQISRVLGYAAADSTNVGELLNRYLALQVPPAKTSPFKLVIANSAWVQQDFPIEEVYRKLLTTDGRATIDLVDFAAKTEAARLAINAWVDAKTEHKIKQLLPPGALDASARLVLANAIYFKGQWAHPFSKQATKDQPFHRPGVPDIRVPMMHKDARFGYLETDTFQAIEMEYSAGGISMVVMLPRKFDGLADLEREISTTAFGISLSRLRPTSVDVFLPTFKISQSVSLAEKLTALGIKDAFRPNADFSGISDEPLFISAVVHQALVEVDEQGTEAAAATGAIATTAAALPEPIEKKIFRADHPFVFAIRKAASGEVLFLGRVQTPNK